MNGQSDTTGDLVAAPSPSDGRPMFGQVTRDQQPSMSEEITDRLRSAIVAGQMQGGQIYSVPGLAAQFGASATPVREAMLNLATQGLVRSLRNRGFEITVPPDRELDEITELRALIEVPTVTRLAGQMTGQLHSLRALADTIVAGANAGDLIGYLTADHAFHLQLLALAGNAELVETVSRLRARTRLYGLEGLMQQGKLADSAYEHREILDALTDGDKRAVHEVMARHIGHIRGIWAKPSIATLQSHLGTALLKT